MTRIVGFTVVIGDDADARAAAERSERAILARFPWLQREAVGSALGPGVAVRVWGFGSVAECVRQDPRDGSLWFVTGLDLPHVPPAPGAATEPAEDPLLHGVRNTVRVWPDRVRVTNDWTGGCRVYSFAGGSTLCLSTLEPVVFHASGLSADAIDPQGLYQLLSSGHYFGDRTLYAAIRSQPPDTTAEYAPGCRRWSRNWTVRPSETRWGSGWASLVDGWQAELEAACRRALPTASPFLLMLSGGLDSRLIAAIARRQGHRFTAVNYGRETFHDTIRATQLSRALDVPLVRVPIDPNYLSSYTRWWCEWFGVSLCTHGMYQFPALQYLRDTGVSAPIATGYVGDPIEGAQIEVLMAGDPGDSPLTRLWRKMRMWRDEDIAEMVPGLDTRSLSEELEALVAEQYAAAEGVPFQKMWFLFLWNHVHPFSSYQPTMYEYFNGVIAPFADARLANYGLSLPRTALEGRRSVMETIRQRYPEVAVIAGTYPQPSQSFDFIPGRYGIPLVLTKRYLAKAALGYLLPQRLRVGPFREFSPVPNDFGAEAIARHGIASLYPFGTVDLARQPVFAADALERRVGLLLHGRAAIAEVNRITPLQGVLHRLLMETARAAS